MGKAHRSQHIANKESKEAELKESNHILKAQVKQLRREVARLRRENEKLTDNISANTEEVMTPMVEPPKLDANANPVPLKVNLEDGCPNGCQALLKKVAMNSRIIVVCPECKWRKVEERKAS